MARETGNEQTQAMRLVFAMGTDVGRKRGHNEDHVDAFRPSAPDRHGRRGELFIVADGMGGHQAGEVASEKAVEAISHEYFASPSDDVRGALVDAVQRANALIHRLAQESPSRAGMGTTAVAAVVRGEELHLANVGDSRAYLLRDGKLAQVTRDHSFVQDQIEAGILTPEEARTHPQRNVVTRALGAKPDVKVDTFEGRLQPGDTLLLCSDGLSEHVPDDDIASLLSQYPPKDAVPRLIALANSRGGSDNVSALVIQVGSPTVTAASAGTPSSEQAAPTSPSEPAKADQGPSLALIAGLSAGGLIILAALIVAFFVGPRFLWGDGTETVESSAQSVLTTPTRLSPVATRSEPTATLASSLPSPSPEQATGGSVAPPTATPRVELRLLEPVDGAQVTPAERIAFRWEAPGTLPEPFHFLVRTDVLDNPELCRGTQRSCSAPLAEGGYQWWVELWSDDVMVATSGRRRLYVQPPTSTPTSAPSATPVPPTNSPSEQSLISPQPSVALTLPPVATNPPSPATDLP